jgi:hypothetical protein
MEYTFEQHNRTSFTLTFHVKSTKDEPQLLLTSDAHYDSSACNRDLFHRHLDKAKEIGAPWIDNGDLFDAMQGRDDRRRQLRDLRPEYKVDEYYDAIVDDAVDRLSQYGDILTLSMQGNHETSVQKKSGTNLTDRFAAGMRATGSKAIAGGYTSFVRVRVLRPNGSSASKRIMFHHGTGGGARTMGIPRHMDTFGWSPDSDIVVMGHNHKDYIIPVERIRCNERGTVGFDMGYMIRIPGYKNAWGGPSGEVGLGGWEVEGAMPPQTQGSALLTFYYEDGTTLKVHPEMMRR